MLEILQLYVSGFWAWLGLTAGLCIALLPILALIMRPARPRERDVETSRPSSKPISVMVDKPMSEKPKPKR